MAQYEYPTSDISTGTWGSTPLWGYIDEVTPTDADFISTGKNPIAATFECKFGSTITDPGDHTVHVLRVRVSDDKNNGTIDLSLYQGTTLIVTSTAIALTTSFAEYSIALSEAQAGNITDYTDLRVRISATGSGNNFVHVSWARFEVPSVSAIKAIAGVVSGQSNIPDRNIKRLREVVAITIVSSSNIPVVVLKRTRPLVGVEISGSSNIPAPTLRRIKSIVGSVAEALSAVSDSVLRVLRELISIPVAGLSTASAIVSLTRTLVGSAGGVSSVPDRNLEVTKALVSVSSDGISGVDGDLTVTAAGGEVVPIQGSISATSDVPDTNIKRVRRFVENLLSDGGLEYWDDAVTPTYWTPSIGGTSTINEESSEVYDGARSLRMDIDAINSTCDFRQDVVLDTDVWHSLGLWTNFPDGGAKGQLRIRVSYLAVGYYWKWTKGIWEEGTSGAYLQLSGTSDAWTKAITKFKSHFSTATHTIRVYRSSAAGISLYWDDLWLKVSLAGQAVVTGDLTVTRGLAGQVDAASGISTPSLIRLKGLAGIIEGTDVFANPEEDGELDTWISATNLTYWSEFPAGASTINQESSEVYSGVYSARFDIDGSSNQVMILNMSVMENHRKITVRFWHNTPVGNYIEFRPRIQDVTSVHFNFTTGLWETAPNFQVCNGTGAWKQETFTYTGHPTYTAATRFQFWVGYTDPGTNFSVYLDKIEVINHPSNVIGVATITKGLAGQVDATSGISDALLETTKSLAGEVDGSSGVDGDLTLSGAVVLQGQVDATSGVPNALLETIKSLVGQVDATSDVPNTDLTVTAGGEIQVLQGQVDAISGVADALLETIKGLVSVSIDGASDVTGDLTISGAVVLQGQVAGVSDVADALLETTKSLAGQVDAISGVADALLETIKGLVSVSIDGASDVTGDLLPDRGLAGQADGVSDVADALLEVVKSLVSVSVDGVSGVTGVLAISGSIDLFGQVDATSDVLDALLEVVKSLVSVSVDAVSGVTGTLTISGSATLQGQVDGVSDVLDAPLKVTRELVSVSVDGVSGVIGALKPVRGVSSVSVDGVSGVTGALKSTKGLISVSVDGVSGVTGTLTLSGSVDLIGRVDGISAVTAARPVGTVTLAGVVGAISTMDAFLKVSKPLVGVSVDGVSAVSGNLVVSEAIFMQGEVDGLSSVLGVLSPVRSVAGVSADGVSAVTGDLKPSRKLSGLSEGDSSVTASLSPQRGLSGSVAASSTIVGRVVPVYKLFGAVVGVSSVTGDLIDKGLYKLLGIVDSVSLVTGSLTVETFLVILLETSVCEIIELETSVAEEVELDSRID